ncbi:hypothetical protein J2129_001740 [Methanofollis sp. W23]|nr:hypothetical protein [Methanofollis sp. W23]
MTGFLVLLTRMGRTIDGDRGGEFWGGRMRGGSGGSVRALENGVVK